MSWTRGSAAWVISVVAFSTALIGCGSSGRGTDDTSTGGTSGGGQNSGGSSVGGSTATGGAGGTSAGGAAPVCPPVDYSPCTPVTRTVADALVYEGASNAGTCATSIATPRVGTWFKYNDNTPAATQTGATELNGRGGADDCAYHSTGTGFNNWGAGFGFSVNNLTGNPSGNLDCTEDDTAFTGLRLYVKGTADATRTQPDYASSPNTIHIKLITSTCRDNDDFGVFCALDAASWTVCDVPFSDVIREGFRDSTYPVAGDTFDPANMIKVQMQLDKFGTAADPAVNYDVWIDDITFY